MVVQHVPGDDENPWFPTAEIGTSYGINAVNYVQEIGFPEGVNVFLDLEAVDVSASTSAVIDYCINWCNEVEQAGFSPGIYVGANPGLNAADLSELPFKYYWKSASNVPVPESGWNLIQISLDISIGGLAVDTDETQDTSNPVLWVSL